MSQAIESKDDMTRAWPAELAQTVNRVLDDQPLNAKTLQRLADMRALALQHAQKPIAFWQQLRWQMSAATCALLIAAVLMWTHQRSELNAGLAEVQEIEQLMYADVNDTDINPLDGEQAELEFLSWLANEQDQSMQQTRSIQ